MISSCEYAEMAGLNIALSHLKTQEPEKIEVIEWIEKRISEIKEKRDATT